MLGRGGLANAFPWNERLQKSLLSLLAVPLFSPDVVDGSQEGCAVLVAAGNQKVVPQRVEVVPMRGGVESRQHIRWYFKHAITTSYR